MIRYKAVQARQLYSFSANTAERIMSSLSAAANKSTEKRQELHKTDLTYAILQINNAENLGSYIWESFTASPKKSASGSGEANIFHPIEATLAKNSSSFYSMSSYTGSSSSSNRHPFGIGTLLMMCGAYYCLCGLAALQAVLEVPLSSLLLHPLSRLLPSLFSGAFLSVPRFIRAASLRDISITAAYTYERSRLLWHCLHTSVDFVKRASVCEVNVRRKQWLFVCSRLIIICIDCIVQ